MRFWLGLKVDFECENERRLAELELSSLLGNDSRSYRACDSAFSDVEAPEVLCPAEYLYAVDGGPTCVISILRRASYWHSVILPSEHRMDARPELDALTVRRSLNHVEILTVSTILERSAYPGFSLEGIIHNEGYLATGHLNSRAVRRDRIKGAHDRRRNVYLSHDFHKYKAKFFPRMSRALINIACPAASDTLLDPFCGSGTANLEAALMGTASIGLDIDPLSVFISSQKTSLEEASAPEVLESLSKVIRAGSEPTGPESAEGHYKLPAFLLRDRAVHLTGTVARDIENEVGAALAVADGVGNPIARNLYRLAISHALATKISLRWMGTGDNRFSVEVAKRSFPATLAAQIHLIRRRLEDFLMLRQAGILGELGSASIGVADVTKLPLPTASVDGIVCSPPYLPASSGRETYLRSRAASLVALGLLSEDEIVVRERDLLGSILAQPSGSDRLPEDVAKLVDWMQPQRARGPKALPTAAYFEKLAKALEQMARVVKPGGTIIVVVSKYHTFYELSSKQVVAQFDMVKNISEMIAESEGRIPLVLKECIDIELGKADFVARPASQNAYFEAVMLLEREQAPAC